MSCERIILECSLAELEALKRLKQPEIEIEESEIDILNVNTSNLEETNGMRRPYLNKTERDIANELSEMALKEYFKAGEFVHIPMTREEQMIISQFKRIHRRKGTQEFSEEDFSILTG